MLPTSLGNNADAVLYIIASGLSLDDYSVTDRSVALSPLVYLSIHRFAWGLLTVAWYGCNLRSLPSEMCSPFLLCMPVVICEVHGFNLLSKEERFYV